MQNKSRSFMDDDHCSYANCFELMQTADRADKRQFAKYADT